MLAVREATSPFRLLAQILRCPEPCQRGSLTCLMMLNVHAGDVEGVYSDNFLTHTSSAKVCTHPLLRPDLERSIFKITV